MRHRGMATWTVLGGTSLAAKVPRRPALDDGRPGRGAAPVPPLCGRDPELLDADGLARAGVESLAENTSDAVVAPLLWGAVAGVPGLLGYRAVNTLDAMVGHRSPRYAASAGPPPGSTTWRTSSRRGSPPR